MIFPTIKVSIDPFLFPIVLGKFKLAFIDFMKEEGKEKGLGGGGVSRANWSTKLNSIEP